MPDPDEILPAVYDELRSVAAHRLRESGAEVDLQPTEIVHEAYLRLTKGGRFQALGRTHFFAVSARAIRNVLVDRARHRAAAKRGGVAATVTLHGDPEVREPVDVLALDSALDRLAELDPRQARIVEMRFFAGMTCDEVAEALAVSRRTVQGDWHMARTWLRAQLG